MQCLSLFDETTERLIMRKNNFDKNYTLEISGLINSAK
jgi:hypothetical protein